MRRRSSKRTRRRPSTTGRDGYLTAKAYAYAIEVIAMLPADRQETSDRRDMLTILINGYGEKHSDALRSNAYAHLTGVGHPAGKQDQQAA